MADPPAPSYFSEANLSHSVSEMETPELPKRELGESLNTPRSLIVTLRTLSATPSNMSASPDDQLYTDSFQPPQQANPALRNFSEDSALTTNTNLETLKGLKIPEPFKYTSESKHRDPAILDSWQDEGTDYLELCLKLNTFLRNVLPNCWLLP